MLEKLNTLCDKLDYKYNVNSGGCCFLAYEIAKHLDRIGLKYDLVVCDDNGKNVENINKEVRTKRMNCDSDDSVTGNNTCYHYFLCVRGFGYINPIGYSDDVYYISGINYKNIKWIYKFGSWNSEYNTEYNSLIRRILNLYFKSYDKE